MNEAQPVGDSPTVSLTDGVSDRERLDRLEGRMDKLLELFSSRFPVPTPQSAEGVQTPDQTQSKEEDEKIFSSTGIDSTSPSLNSVTVKLSTVFINPLRPTLTSSAITQARQRGTQLDKKRNNFMFNQGQESFKQKYTWWSVVEFFRMQQDLNLHISMGAEAKSVHPFRHLAESGTNGGISPRQLFVNRLREMLATLAENPKRIAHPYSTQFLALCPSSDDLMFLQEEDFLAYAEISILPRNEEEICKQLKQVIEKWAPKYGIHKARDITHFHSCFIELAKYVKLVLELANYSVYGSQEQIAAEDRKHFPIKIPKSQNRGYVGFQELLQEHMKALNIQAFWSEIETQIWIAANKPKDINDYMNRLVTHIHDAYISAIRYKPYDDAMARDGYRQNKEDRPAARPPPPPPAFRHHVTVLQDATPTQDEVLGKDNTQSDLLAVQQAMSHLHDKATKPELENDIQNPKENDTSIMCDQCFTALQSASASSPGCYAQLFFEKCVTPNCKWSHGKHDLQVLARKTIERWQHTLLQNDTRNLK